MHIHQTFFQLRGFTKNAATKRVNRLVKKDTPDSQRPRDHDTNGDQQYIIIDVLKTQNKRGDRYDNDRGKPAQTVQKNRGYDLGLVGRFLA